MIVAVTGNLGSGKSTASKVLARMLGAEHVDADQVCRLEMLPGRQGYETFRKLTGPRFLDSEGRIDRVLLRQAVFDDGRIKQQLEDILHPIVRRFVRDLHRDCRRAQRDLVVEVPLLFEVGWEQDFDVKVVVFVPEDMSLLRVMRRDGMAAAEIRRVFGQQLPIGLKREKADFVIDNSGTFASTFLQLAWLGKKLKCERKLWESTDSRLKSLTVQI